MFFKLLILIVASLINFYHVCFSLNPHSSFVHIHCALWRVQTRNKEREMLLYSKLVFKINVQLPHCLGEKGFLESDGLKVSYLSDLASPPYYQTPLWHTASLKGPRHHEQPHSHSQTPLFLQFPIFCWFEGNAASVILKADILISQMVKLNSLLMLHTPFR